MCKKMIEHKKRLAVFTLIPIVLFMIVMMSGTTCILVVEGAPHDWLGSVNGCGPTLTYKIHQYFGMFW